MDPSGVAHLICLALTAASRAPADDEATRLLEDVLRRRLGAEALVEVLGLLREESRDAATARLTARLAALPVSHLPYLVTLAREVVDAHAGEPDPPAPAGADDRPAATTTAVIRAEQRHLADITAMLGPDHPDTLAARFGLAKVYRWAGRHADAIRTLERLVADRERLFAAGHRDTLDAKTVLRAWRAARRPDR